VVGTGSKDVTVIAGKHTVEPFDIEANQLLTGDMAVGDNMDAGGDNMDAAATGDDMATGPDMTTPVGDMTWPTGVVTLDVTTVAIAGAQGTVALAPSSPYGTRVCGVNCTRYAYDPSISVQLTATGNPLFQKWSGDCSGIGTKTSKTGTCTLKTDVAHSATAVFRPAVNYAFVTSTTYAVGTNITAGGGSGPSLCAARASAAGLSGTYDAWLGAEATPSGVPPASPSAYFPASSVGWIRPDGAVVAANKTALLSGTLANPISVDEFGTDQTPNAATTGVLTGANADGTYRTGATCSGWTDTSTSLLAGTGRLDSTNSNWTYRVSNHCSFSFRLYCFEVDF
jgi:hypothetical protein